MRRGRTRPTSATRSSSPDRREDDAAVGAEAEAPGVGGLPSMAGESPEDAGVTAVERLGRFTRDASAAPARLLDDLVHLLPRSDVVREGDAAPAGAVVGDSRVGCQLRPVPQRDDDPVRLVERRLLNL